MSPSAMYRTSTKFKFWEDKCNVLTCPQFVADCLITVFQFYCPWESRIWLLFSFSTNLALQRLTGSEGEVFLFLTCAVCGRELTLSAFGRLRSLAITLLR